MTILAQAFLIGFMKAAGLSAPSGSTNTAATPELLAHPVTKMPGGQIVPRPTTNPPIAPKPQTNVNSWTNGFDAKAFANHAILPAEHNPNYGILTKYHNTTPEQASINTINHALRDFESSGGGSQEQFINMLGNRYAPTNGVVANDPTHLNKNWIPNVTKFWNQYQATNHLR